MDLIVIIILCVVIALALIIFPLVVSRKAENAAVKKVSGIKFKITEIRLIEKQEIINNLINVLVYFLNINFFII